MIYQNYRTTVKQHQYVGYTIHRDFSYMTLKEIDQEIERTIEQISLYQFQGVISRCLTNSTALLIGFSNNVGNILNPVGSIRYDEITRHNPFAQGADAWAVINQLEQKLNMLKSRRRDLVNR